MGLSHGAIGDMPRGMANELVQCGAEVGDSGETEEGEAAQALVEPADLLSKFVDLVPPKVPNL